MQAWQISSKWEKKKTINISRETDQRFKYTATNISNRTRVDSGDCCGQTRDLGGVRKPYKAVSLQAVCPGGFVNSQVQRQTPGQMTFQDPAEFSILAINVRAQLPWKHAQSSHPRQVPWLCDVTPRCSTIWQWLSDIRRHCSVGNNSRFTNVLAIRDRAMEADTNSSIGLAQSNPSFPREASVHIHKDLRPCLCRRTQLCTCDTADWLNG